MNKSGLDKGVWIGIVVLVVAVVISSYFFAPSLVGYVVKEGKGGKGHDKGKPVKEPAPEPPAEEPAVEEPATEEPTIEESVSTEDPSTEEPAAEEPAAEEPAAEEPAAEEPVSEEASSTEVVSEDLDVVVSVGEESENVSEEIVLENVSEDGTSENVSESKKEKKDKKEERLKGKERLAEKLERKWKREEAYRGIEVEEVNDSTASEVEVETIQYDAVIGRPVKWLNRINVTKKGKLNIRLPRGAGEIAVLTKAEVAAAKEEVGEYKELVRKSNKRDLARGGVLTGHVVSDIKEGEGIITRFWNWMTDFVVTGKVISEEDMEENIVEDEDGLATLNLSDVSSYEDEIGVEYYTEAPAVVEEDVEDGKRVVISTVEELGYKDILSYMELDVEVNESELELYHVVEGERVAINFTAFDLNNNSLIDYVEWNIEHLSEQVFELVISPPEEEEEVVEENVTEEEVIEEEVVEEEAVEDEGEEVIEEGDEEEGAASEILDKDINGRKYIPQISVEDVPSQNPLEGDVRNVRVNFLVYDEDGIDDIHFPSAKVSFQKGGVSRTSEACVKVGRGRGSYKVEEDVWGVGIRNIFSGANIRGGLGKKDDNNYARYSCVVGMRDSDEPGKWHVNVSISDKKGFRGWNFSDTFHYNLFISPTRFQENETVWPTEDCAGCEKGMQQLRVKYIGDKYGLNVKIYSERGRNKNLIKTLIVNSGDVIVVDSLRKKLAPKTFFYVTGDDYEAFFTVHTSCSEYIIDNVYEDFVVIGHEDGVGNNCSTSVDYNVSKEAIVNITTTQYDAVIGRWVKWLKRIEIIRNGPLVVELPPRAENISILVGDEIDEVETEMKNYNLLVGESSGEDLVSGFLTGNVVSDIEKSKGVLTRFWEWIVGFGLTGHVVYQEDILEDIVWEENRTLVNVTKFSMYEDEIGISYYTEEPVAIGEENISIPGVTDGKRIVISGDDVYGYTNILAYTTLETEYREGRIKLYHVVDDERVPIDFTGYDLNDNGLVDYIEWNVEHLSEQVYDLIIEITKAEVLDENRSVLRDVYLEVSVLDDVWASVMDGEYLRVVFEENLTSGNDITIYPKVISGSPVIEVYEKDGSEVIAQFDNLTSEEYNKVYLVGLVGVQDSFDLRVVGGVVEFDYVVDPVFATDIYDDCNSAVINASKFVAQTTSGDEGDVYATGTGYYRMHSTDNVEMTLYTSGLKDDFAGFTAEAYLDEERGNGRGWSLGIGTGGLYAQTSCRANTGWVPSNGYYVCFYGNNGGTQLYRVDSGSDTQIASNSNNVQTDGYYNYTMELNSSGVFVFVDDVLWISSSDTTYSEGYITISTGGGGSNKGNISIDNVWDILAGSSNSPPTTPTSIMCDGGSCNGTFGNPIDVECSGSVDPEGDAITYVIEASSGEVLGETGSVDIANHNSVVVALENSYSSTPIVVATPVTQNAGAADDDSALIPVVETINTTHITFNLCQDNGASTCDTSVVSETVHYFVFDVDAEYPEWIAVGKQSGVSTNGANTAINFGKTFSNVPYVWTQAQTANQGNNIAGMAWADDITTSGANLLGCTHQGTGNSCDGGTPSEDIGWVAIDVVGAGFAGAVNFQYGANSIRNSGWTAVGWNANYSEARMMVTQNDDNGGQDPQYAWARDVDSSTPDFRYCEQDGADDCDRHNNELVVWFAMEQGSIFTGQEWNVIGNHTAGGSYSWDTSGLEGQSGIDLRCRAIDLAGSNTYSDYYTGGFNLTISGNVTYELSVANVSPNGGNLSYFDIAYIQADIMDGDGVDASLVQMVYPNGSLYNFTMRKATSKVVDGERTDWVDTEIIDIDQNEVLIDDFHDLAAAYVSNNDTDVVFREDFYGDVDFSHPAYYEVMIDADLNSSTGWSKNGAWDYGYEYMIENGGFWEHNGVGGGWGWSYVGAVDYAISSDSKTIEWILDRSLIGDVGIANILFTAGVGNVTTNDFIPNSPDLRTASYKFYTEDTYKYVFNDTQYMGRYNFTIFANDTLGEVNDSEGGYFDVLGDITPPGITLIYPYDNYTYYTSDLNFTCDVTDEVQLSNVTLYSDVYGSWSEYSTGNVSGTENSSSWYLSGIDSGLYEWNCLGCDTSGNCKFYENNWTFNVSLVGSPEVVYVSPIVSVNPIESSYKSVDFYVTAYDSDGVDDLNDTSVVAKFTKSGEPIRQNLSCSHLNDIDANSANYSCSVGMWYFDAAGTWNVSVSVEDVGGFGGKNTTESFVYNQLTAMAMYPNSLNWGEINYTGSDFGSLEGPVSINNTGNAESLSVGVTSYDLQGQSFGDQFIYANNFTVGGVGGGCLGDRMINGSFVNVTELNLGRGNNSLSYLNSSSGQEEAFFCLKGIPPTIRAQEYLSGLNRSWEIAIV